jgi:creatinine amidohydrolase
VKVADLRSPALGAAIARGAVALWPIGSTEAHGPHLPLGTDVIIAAETCRRVAARGLVGPDGAPLEVLEYPPLAFTLTDFAAPFPGTITLPRDSVFAYVREVAAGLARSGVRAVCLVNAHLEPAHRFLLRDAVKAARVAVDEGAAQSSTRGAAPVGLADPADARWARSLGEEFASGSCHAGRYETSLVLAAAAPLVDADRAHDLPTLPIDLVARIRGGARDFAEAGAVDAYCGAPAEASRDEGEARYARLVEIVDLVVGELLATSAAPPRGEETAR